MIATTLLAVLLPVLPPEPLPLTLEDCIGRALESNLTLAASRLDAASAREDFGAAWGTFDTQWFFDGTASEFVSAPGPATVNEQGVLEPGISVDSDRVDLRTGLRGTLLSGLQWQFDIGPNKRSTDIGFSQSTEYTGQWNLSLVVPVLRGGGDFERSALELARQDAFIAWVESEDQAHEIVQLVIEAYWNVLFAERDLETRELALEIAEELLNLTRRRFEEGLQTRIDVVEVEAELATRREELVAARYALIQALDDLRELVFAPTDLEEWNQELELLTRPSEVREVETDEREAIDVALAHRPDVIQARLAHERSAIEVERAENQELARLDVTTFYGQNSNASGFGKTLGELDRGAFKNKGITLNWEMPFGNHAAEHARRRAQLQRRRARVRLREAEMNAIGEVRAAVRDLSLQVARVEATEEAVRLNEERYQGEVRQLENDLSTPFQVREAQRDLLASMDTNTRAILDYENARTQLLRAQGRLLEAYGVRYESPVDLSLEDAPDWEALEVPGVGSEPEGGTP